jgi:5-methylcytosine-specific restriction enzyme A
MIGKHARGRPRAFCIAGGGGWVGRLAALKPRLARLAPNVAFLRDTEAQIDKRRGEANAARSNYKTQKWRRLRWQVLVEALFTCARCGVLRGDDTSQLVADHVVPHRGDEALFWDHANLQCLCKTCHDSVKQSEDRRHGR